MTDPCHFCAEDAAPNTVPGNYLPLCMAHQREALSYLADDAATDCAEETEALARGLTSEQLFKRRINSPDTRGFEHP